MGLAWRARAALVKGGGLLALGLWVIGSTAWHAYAGTLPAAEVMGAVGVLALAANAAVAIMLYRFRTATPTCAQCGSARAMMRLGIWL
jgi:hypothetical protein